MNYEISKTRKYKKDIGKMENMEYDPEKDSYRCQNRKMLQSNIRENKRQQLDISGRDCLSMP